MIPIDDFSDCVAEKLAKLPDSYLSEVREATLREINRRMLSHLQKHGKLITTKPLKFPAKRSKRK